MKSATKTKGKQPKSSKSSATSRGTSHHIAEVALAYVLKRSPEFMERLAKLLGRTPGAVEQLWGWCEGAEVPTPVLKDQLERVQEFLGPDLRSSLVFKGSPVKPPLASSASSVAPVPFDPSCGCGEPDRERVHLGHSIHSMDPRS